MRIDSYYFLVLYIPALYAFYVLMTWSFCKPISGVGSYVHLLKPDEAVPRDATCFATNHMTSLSFYNYPPIEQNMIAYVGLWTLVVLLFALLVPANVRLFLNRGRTDT